MTSIASARMSELSLMPANIVPIDVSERAIGVMVNMLNEQDGQPVPLLVQRGTNRVFFGGEIFLALQKLGAAEAEVIYSDCTDKQAARLAVQMRRSVELSGWKQDELTRLLLEWEDPEALGFDDDEFKAMLDDLERGAAGTNDAADPGPAVPENLAELQKKWGTARGQLWLIASKSVPGKYHRLLIGDSANEADVARVMNGQRAALFATDPPYAINYTGDSRPAEGKDWGAVYHEAGMTDAQCEEMYRGFMRHAIAHAIKPNAAWYCWHAAKRQGWLEKIWAEFGVLFHQQIIWNKESAGTMTYSHYRWKHEPCLFGWVQGNEPKISDGMMAKENTVWDAAPPHATKDSIHPTSKPTILFEKPMLMHTLPGDICYEPFAGSGSEHVAGEKLGRLVYGIEISEYFAAGILERMSGLGCEIKPNQEDGS